MRIEFLKIEIETTHTHTNTVSVSCNILFCFRLKQSVGLVVSQEKLSNNDQVKIKGNLNET